MDIRQLRYFIAVAEARNFGRAAERLHLSQPPLTRQIQALEQELGVALFVRTPRGVDMTQAGAQLLADARNITGLVGQASERAQRAGRGQVGRLDVGLYGSAMYDLVPRLLADFGATHPDVKIVLYHAQTPQQVQALRHGQVQIVFERQVPVEADIAVELVAREPIMLAINALHPLARETIVPMEALRGQALVMQTGAASALTNAAMALCRAHGVEPADLHEVNDVLTGTILVATTPAMCLVPASMSRVQLPNVVYRPIRSRIDAFMELHCFYLRADTSPVLAAMLGTIRAHRHADQPASAASSARLRSKPQR